MTKSYKIFSWAYCIILGMVTAVFLVKSSFSVIGQDNDNSGLWLLLHCISTLTAIPIFHSLGNDNRYKIFVWFLVCALVLLSLGVLLFFRYSIFKNGDGNLLLNAVLSIAIIVNAVLLFYLIQDKKYNQNGWQQQQPLKTKLK